MHFQISCKLLEANNPNNLLIKEGAIVKRPIVLKNIANAFLQEWNVLISVNVKIVWTVDRIHINSDKIILYKSFYF